MIGQTVSHYKILEKIGEGGMGEVYLAEDTKLKRTVALKFISQNLLKNEEEKIRFVTEAQSAAAINHPNVTIVHEINESDDKTFIVMEHVEGQNLKDKIQKGPFSMTEAIAIFLKIAQGLRAAHEKQVVHRDIKSSNIMVTTRGAVKIMDFGLAKLRGRSELTRAGTTVGTAAYMSPEQALGKEITPQSDIWSLGVVFYEMLTGRLPFQGDYEQAIIYAILNEKPSPIAAFRKDVSPELEKIIERMLAKDPSNRYRSMDQLMEDFSTFDSLTAPGTASLPPRPVFSPNRKRFFKISAAIMVPILVVLGAFLLLKKGSNKVEQAAGKPAESGWTKSIAVLPFADLSPNQDQEYFCDGMTEDIITKLTHIRELKVISRTSIMRYKNTQKDIKDIGRELGVTTVLEGSIRREGDNIRVSAQLINIKDGFHLWADTIDRKMASVFEVQDEVSRSIAEALHLQLSPDNLSSKRPENLKVYEANLRANQLLSSYLITENEEDFVQAIGLLNKALETDPNYASTYIGLAWVHANHWEVTSDPKDLLLVESYIKTGYGLNPELAGANLGMAWLAFQKNDQEQTRHFLIRANKLNPNIAEVNHLTGWILNKKGLPDKAIKYLKKAIELNPLYIYSPGLLARCYREIGDWEKAENCHQKVLAMDPDSFFDHLVYAFCLIMMKQYEEAQNHINRAETLDPRHPSLPFYQSLLYAAQSQKKPAKEKMGFFSDKIYALLGMKQEALEALKLRKQTEPMSVTYLHLVNNPCYDTLRDDPRFQEILEQTKKEYQERLIVFKDL